MIPNSLTVPDFPNYSVTVDGQVFNQKTNRVLKSSITNSGYQRVALSTNGSTSRFSVHRLVLKLWGSEPPSDTDQCNHIDGDKQNNHIFNLEWVTASQNQQHAVDMGLRKMPLGSKASQSKLDEAQVHRICQMLLTKKISHSVIGKEFNVSRATIGDIATGACWRQISIEYWAGSLEPSGLHGNQWMNN